MSAPPDAARIAEGERDCLGHLRWASGCCPRCGYRVRECTCPVPCFRHHLTHPTHLPETPADARD